MKWRQRWLSRTVAPSQVRAQIEGNLVWGVGMALHESFELENGIAATDNFHNYSTARMDDVPPLHIELVDSQVPATGTGEAAFAPVAAAIAKAVFRTTNRRYRQLPIRYG
jgi:isoquinoline 1-oxidoreductase beta subunit